MKRYFCTIVALSLSISMVHADGPTKKGGAGSAVQPKPKQGRAAPSNIGFRGVAIPNLPNGGAKPGFYGSLQGQPCNCTGKTVIVRKVFPPTVKRVIAVPVGWSPKAKNAFNTAVNVTRALGAGRGVALGKLVAGAFTVNQAKWLFVELEQVYVDYEFTYACVCGRFDLVSGREVNRGVWTIYEQLYNKNLDNGPNWFGDETGADVAAAVAQALAKYGA